MSNNTIRVKLIVLPQNERLCILSNSTHSINELQQSVYEALLQFPSYQRQLKTCNVILELRMDGQDFAISGYYLLREILKDVDDLIVVKIVNKANCMFQRLQPQPMEIPHQSQPIIKDFSQHFKTSNIFDSMTAIGKVEHDAHINKDYKKHIAILAQLKVFCLDWLNDQKHLLFDELSQVLYSLFPEQINYLKSTFFMTSKLSFQHSLFIELGLKRDVDPHINVSINFNENNYRIDWKNYIVFENYVTDKLWNYIQKTFIKDIVSWNQYGFGILSKEYFEETKTEWFNQNIKTVSGQNLVEHNGWHRLIAGLRHSRLMLYAYNSKRNAIKLIKTLAFRSSISKDPLSINVDKWLRFCLDRKIVPMALLKYWITESKDSFITKKDFNKLIKTIVDIPARHKHQWTTQKNEYYLESGNDVHHLAEKYPLYWKARCVCDEYIKKHKDLKHLNTVLCDEMIELCLNDCVQGANDRGIHEVASCFEDNIVDKFRLITSCINNIGGCVGGIKMLDQKQQISFWSFLRKKYCYEANESQRGTPDILFNQPIIINEKKVYWIDAKHWFVSRASKILFKNFVESVTKYTKAYGPGAIVCHGFEQNIHQYQSIQQYNVTLLDGSRDLSIYQQLS